MAVARRSVEWGRFPLRSWNYWEMLWERALPACVSHDARVGRKSSTRCAAFVYDIHWEQCDTIRATFFHTWDWWCPDRSHQTFRPVLAVKLRGLCWEILDVSWHQFSHYYSRRCWRMVLELTGVISPWGSLHTRAKSRDHGIVRARCKRKCPKATVPTHPQHHVVVWSWILKCSVKLYVTGPSTKCYVNERLYMHGPHTW